MFRRALTYQLIFAVAAGPLLCCCTAGRLSASAVAQSAGSTAISESSSPSVKIASPCCAHKHTPAAPDTDHNRPDHKPVPSKPVEKCPCKDGSGKPETIQTEVTSVDVSTFLRFVTHDLDLPDAIVGCTSCPTQIGKETSALRGSCASRLTTADLLFAHHKLRC